MFPVVEGVATTVVQGVAIHARSASHSRLDVSTMCLCMDCLAATLVNHAHLSARIKSIRPEDPLYFWMIWVLMYQSDTKLFLACITHLGEPSTSAKNIFGRINMKSAKKMPL